MTTSARNGHDHATSTNGHGPRIGKPYLIDPRLDPTHPIHRLAVTSSTPPDAFCLGDIIQDDRDVLAGTRILKLRYYPALLRVIWARIRQADPSLPVGASHAAAIRYSLHQLTQDIRVTCYAQVAAAIRAGTGLTLQHQTVLCGLLGLGAPTMAYRPANLYAAPGRMFSFRCHDDIADAIMAAAADLGLPTSALGATCIANAFARDPSAPPDFIAWAAAQWDSMCEEAGDRSGTLSEVLAIYRARTPNTARQTP